MPDIAISLGPLLADSAERLRRAGVPEPRRQVCRLWAELGGIDAVEAWARPDGTLEPTTAQCFQQAVERRIQGEPLPHITGWAGFRHLSLHCDRRALIPRPETEGLVDLLLQRVRSGLVADIGTGGGCIALSLAIEGTFAHVIGVDRSSEALSLARMNRELVGSGTPVSLVHADFCAPLREEGLDALISNPPYLTAAEHASLDDSVRLWEPALALVSGADGMDAISHLLGEGWSALRPGGWLALEIDCARARSVAQRAREVGWAEVAVHMDLFGRERYLLAQRSETR
jgi:release factor glutamine methyltransferase